MIAKYILVEDNSFIPYVYIFSSIENHVDVFVRVASGKNLISAGFIDLSIMQCYGESISLKVKSRPEDDDIIKSIFKR